MVDTVAKSLISHPLRLVAVGFGSGLVPRVPGTAGTLAAVPIFVLIGEMPTWAYVTVVLIAVALGIWACQHTTEFLQVHDHPVVVCDEIVGFLIGMTGSPVDVSWIVAGFVVFRFFDIVKPWPINWMDRRVPGGLGVMVDDVVAGLYTALLLQALAVVL